MNIDLKNYLRDRDEVFTHRDDDGTFRTFPAGAMRRLAEEFGGRCKQIIAAQVPLVQNAADHIRSNGGIEPERIARLASPYLERPIIGISWDAHQINLLIVDGNHRYIKLFDAGTAHINCYVFMPPFWEQLLIPMPKHLRSDPFQYSGVLEAERAGWFKP